MEESAGLVKILADSETDEILGVHMVGPRVSELIAEAVVTMELVADYANVFPEDTSASIFTAGLLGEQYVSLEPGGSDISLQDGDEIQLTQSALVMEQVVGKFLFSQAAEAEP